MGQRQSNEGAADAQEPIKTSYYALLGVERQATDDEIKKAYRRKALELHPDRNYGKEDEATKLFAEVQTAYEVLSDPQERAWYDSHESAILRGSDGGEGHFEGSVRFTTAEEVVAMIGKFNGRVRFDDSPEGFFGFLRDAFAKLAQEEEISASLEGVDVPDYPSFGHKDDTHDGVVQDFYRGWAGFSTKKSFAWKDQYRLNEAADRRVKRLMEKHNKKLREEGIREYNDAVRALVAFVRKRDPRYKPNTQSEAERQKALREASAAQAARARAANAAKMDEHVPEWTKVRDQEEQVEESTEEESEEEHFECVACHKRFKSEKQFEAHERSKKHQKAVHALRRQMQKDNAMLNLDEDTESSGMNTGTATPQDDGRVEHVEEKNMAKMEELDLSDKSEGQHSSDLELGGETANNEEEGEEVQAAEDGLEVGNSDDDSDYVPRSRIKSRLNGHLEHHDDALTGLNKEEDEKKSEPAQKKLGAAAKKRAKRAAKAAEAQEEAEDLKFTCAQCNARFPSRTRMFQHIKDLGHAAPVPAGKGKSGKKR
ncbi:uncharacterized protein PV09_05916 [Verruconis gallopava]|uniref:J domain-containing protein n=1 Tax=Verruconis gallopava TaxID=253628 RepID=A0A0D2A7X7_9PEZI|nr:uncharacterized protein PV09_05916 [Verruconis gallopava]KIW02863.1 hypothetical protein PV09_05916 [Verruconis gallopava]